MPFRLITPLYLDSMPIYSEMEPFPEDGIKKKLIIGVKIKFFGLKQSIMLIV